MKVYITKYALSKGIIEAEVEQVTPAVVRYENEGKSDLYYGGEWYTDQERAISEAEQMRSKQIERYKCSIDRLKKMVFKVGKQHNEVYRTSRSKAVVQYSMDNEIIEEYKSIVEVERKTGFSVNGIHRCCNGAVEQYKGYVWKYKDSKTI